MNNPLIAETQDSTEAYSGIPLLESVFDTKQAIESGDWAAGVMGVIGAGLDMLGAVMDPIGTILSSGVGWLLEHVGPLSDALDALTGDPDQIRAHSETWSNVAGELASISSDLLQAVEEDTTTWTGPAADTYRQRGADTATLIQAAQSAAEGASSGIATAGEVVAAVRTLVRDIIAEVVGRLVSWALQVVATLGIGLSWVVPQVTRTVAKVASQISDLVTKLVEAMSKLGPLLAKLGSKFQEATSKLKKIKSGDPGATRSVEGGNTTPSGFSGTNGDRGGSGGGAPKTDPPPRSEPTTDSTTTTSGSSTPPAGRPRSGDTTPSTTRGGRNDTVPAKDRNCVGDPVDVATGEVVVTQIDLTLPHLTHPAFERTHVSSYREGRWFGPSWSSTLDQRLELHDRTVRYFAPDGMILTYPVPSAPGSVFPKTGPQWPLSRHDDGDWTLEQRPAGRTLRFAGSGDVLPLRAVEGADGERSELAYDESGAPTVLTHSNGVRLGFRVEDSRVTELSVLGSGDVPDVVVMRYGYDDRRQLTAVVNSSGVPMRFDYDSQGRITGWQDRNGVWYRYVYDSAGRCVRTVGTDGFLDSVFTYDPERRVTTHTDSLGNTTVYELNEAHQTVRETDPLGNVTAFEWNHANQLIARTDPLGRVTRYAYGADGLPVSITRPDGSVVSLDHDADTLTSFTVVENDRAWTRHFTESAPDPVDEPIGVATALDLSAPPAFEPSPVTDDRDQFGRPRSLPVPGGGRVLLGWTVDGARALQIGPNRSRATWRYDGEGNEIEHVDELGRVTRREYGPFDLLTAEIDPTGARTEYRYDTELQLVSVTDPLGRVWSYRYDAAGRLTGQTDFDGRVWSFEHDPAGQLVRTTRPDGEVLDYRYDLLGNLVEVRTPHGTTRYDYDPAGDVVRVTSEDSVVEFERDADGRVVREVVDGLAVTFAYDAERNTIRRRTPSGVESEWFFDESQRPVALRVEGHDVHYQRDADGRVVRRITDGRTVLSQSFGIGEHVAEQLLSTGDVPLQRRAYEYQADGRLAALRDDVAVLTLTRDAAGRVLTDGRDAFRYDPAGNLVAWSSSPGLALDYDASGRRIRYREATPDGERVWEYSWTGDLLTGLRTPDGRRWRYRYDPLGRRIAKERLASDGSVAESTRFVWDGTTLIEQIHLDEHGVTRSTTWERLPTDRTPVTQLEHGPDGQRFHSVVTDSLGTPTELVDETGALAWAGRRSVWGRVSASPTSPTSIPLRFPGQYADDESGLHYNVFRYYDPVTARYLSQDPLGMAAGSNPTAYVTDPFFEFDALGLMRCSTNPSNSTNPAPPTGAPAQHNANNAGGSANTPTQPSNKRKRNNSGNTTTSSSKKQKQTSPWDRGDFNKDTLKHIKDEKTNNPDYAGSKVHARHVISFQTIRDSMKKWVNTHYPPSHPQHAAMLDKYVHRVESMNNNTNNLPLGSGAPNSSIGLTVKNMGIIQERIDGRHPTGNFVKDQHGNYVLDQNGNRIREMEPPMKPSEAFEKSSGYQKSIRDEFAKPIMQAVDGVTDTNERNTMLKDVEFSADFDWPGGTRQEFEEWKYIRNQFKNIEERPGDYTQDDVDTVINRFFALAKPSGSHESLTEWQNRPK